MNVYQAFSAVQKDLSDHGIAKGQQNQQQRYQYRGIDDVYNTLGPLLAKHGLIIIPRVVESEQTHLQKGTHWKAKVEYNVYGPDGDKMEPAATAHGECIDYGDKGLNKACTAAYKFWVLSAFCVPLEGNEDADSVSPEVTAPVAQEGTQTLSSDERKEILGLCMQTNTNVDQFVGWLGYTSLSEVPISELSRATEALNQKLHKMEQTYAQEEQLTAQSLNQGA
jgi:hypothetical protein